MVNHEGRVREGVTWWTKREEGDIGPRGREEGDMVDHEGKGDKVDHEGVGDMVDHEGGVREEVTWWTMREGEGGG